MKAKTISENIDFKRGSSPKETLGIGRAANNEWNRNPPTNIFFSRYLEETKKELSYLPPNHFKTLEEVGEKTAELLRTDISKIRVFIEPADDWDDEFDDYDDYLESPKYFDENNTYLGDRWEPVTESDLESIYEGDNIIKRVSLKIADGDLQLGEDGNVYWVSSNSDIYDILGTIY